jgi:HD-GYP domain-containing protein (c-di-GMP phosphodiesterase class II)
MGNQFIRSQLIQEESRAVWLYIALFYLIRLGYDVFYYYIMPTYVLTEVPVGLPDGGLGYWIYIIEIALLPLAIYFIRNKNPRIVKYFYFSVFIIITLINELFIYIGSDQGYESGNIVEFYFVLFSPIFVNTRFFFTIIIGLILKYAIMGVAAQEPQVLIPVAIITLFAIVAYILLSRFQSYVRAIENSYGKQMEGIVSGIIASLELKDPYTRGHSQRVARYSTILAEKTGSFTNYELKLLNYACLLHDIGKVNIPDSILMKPGRLTEEEFEIIKTHPTVGSNAVIAMEGFEECVGVVLSHHERWDGKGYPNGLKGEEIPYSARITAIADAFDAMTTSRSYRSALSPETAYERIIEGSGTQFDPKLVEVFKNNYPLLLKLMEQESPS